METASPDLEECSKFAQGVKASYPDIMLAYNLSPSFNWDAAGMSDEEMRTSSRRLREWGSVGSSSRLPDSTPTLW
ncbi:hypothetical protein HPP92_012389 [Vanilla planifolia]|uniref:Uncharacterized protein n=1 Tax=Vanilla planifolia TaxID=51239 RepID=A0A835R2H3_VANPL|nr:hypothetical protein HPP92_012389 [Vanilla planifolia]